MEPRVEVVGHLDTDELRRVTVLAERATEADGSRPMSEHVMLHLRHGGDTTVRHILVYDGDELAGYAHVDPTDAVAGSSAELVVDPRARGKGVGRRLVSESLAVTPDKRLRLWAHGDHPAAARLASAFGMAHVRTLWQMRRSLFAPLPASVLPPAVHLRPFIPGQDEAAWLELNAQAFADHPEQGQWEMRDLELRLEEPWFDPRGFFLAERVDDEGARLIAFHWTKVHGGSSPTHTHSGPEQSHPHPHTEESPHGHGPIGEVYVVGVSPQERGTGLGRAVTLAGLAHLRSCGLPEVMLYVDEDNRAAIALYEKLGFAVWDRDLMFTT